MRPMGEFRLVLAEVLRSGPLMTREAATKACLSVADARATLDNMCRAGQAVKCAPARVPGVRRPVPVYALAERAAPALRTVVDQPYAAAAAEVLWWPPDNNDGS